MATVSCGGTKERYRFIARNRKIGIKKLCQWLGVSRSGFYAWHTREASERTQEDKWLLDVIRSIHEASRGTYGSPRVHKALRKQGIYIGKKRVERLMQMDGLQGRVVKVTRRQPGFKRFLKSGNNLRLRMPPVTQIDQVWVSDITFLKVSGEWHYLAVIMDLHSRRILGWSLGVNRTTDLTLAALQNALRRRIPKEGLIFHTDRGIEYTGFRFRNALQKYGIKPSVNRLGYCTDNAHMESFFHTLKAELIRGRTFQSEYALRHALKGYINRFYNHRRLHSGIGYVPPVDYERMVA